MGETRDVRRRLLLGKGSRTYRFGGRLENAICLLIPLYGMATRNSCNDPAFMQPQHVWTVERYAGVEPEHQHNGGELQAVLWRCVEDLYQLGRRGREQSGDGCGPAKRD